MLTYSQFATKLNESTDDTAVLVFGRFNPPTAAHIMMLHYANEIAIDNNAKLFVFVSTTTDTNKNPLNVDQKIKFIKQMAPVLTQSVTLRPASEGYRTFLQCAEELYKSGFDNLIMVCGDDRKSEFTTILNRYNGELYSFKNITVMSMGARDPDSDGLTGISASKMRVYASQNSLNDYIKGLPTTVTKDAAETMMNAVRAGLNLTQDKT